MVALLRVLVTSIIAFFGASSGLFGDGIYEFTVWFFEKLIKYLTIASLSISAVMLKFAWDVGKQLVDDLGAISLIVSAWDALPPVTASLLSYLRVPEALHLLVTAFAAKFAMRFIPFV